MLCEYMPTTLIDALSGCEYICVGGCGTRAVFFYGMFEALKVDERYEKFLSGLKGAAGSSSGCMIALLFLMRGNPSAMAEMCLNIGKEFDTVAPALNMQTLFDSYGLDTGDTLYSVIGKLLTTLGLSVTTTFSTLQRMTQKEFKVSATNLHTRTPFIFSADTSPDLPIIDAMYMSMTVPIVFKPRRYKGELYVDGGMTANVPICAFHDKSPVLLYLNQNQRSENTTLKEFAMSVVGCTLGVQSNEINEYHKSHPCSVFEFDDDNQAPLNLDGNIDFLTQQRKRGFVAGMVQLHQDVTNVIATLVALSLGCGGHKAPTSYIESCDSMD